MRPSLLFGARLTVVLQIFLRFIEIPIVLVLLLYNLRRILFALVALTSERRNEGEVVPDHLIGLPNILILVPCRDEEDMIAGLCQSLDRLDYPGTEYQVVLIDDGSCDDTRRLMERNVRGRSGWHMLSLPENVGKASAMNAALAQFSFGEMVFVFDADHRPQPDVLKRAMSYFKDEHVAGVSGRVIPVNPLASPSAYYSSVESHVHQMVTMRAKDRLGLAPALLGSNCCYRRTALAQCGGYRPGSLLEDTDLTLAFYRAGYLVRFAEDVVAYHQVPETATGYLKQHTRWARGFNDAILNHFNGLVWDRRMSIPLRFELFLFVTGYLDRIALVGAGLLTALSFLNRRFFQFPRQIFYFALLTPLSQIIALFAGERMPLAMWLRLPWVPVFFMLDLYASARAMGDSILNRTRVWIRTERV